MASKQEAIGYLKALISAEKGERLPQPEFGKDRLRALETIVEAFEGESSGGGSTGGGLLVVHGTITLNADESTDYTIDKTWQELYDAGFAVLRIVRDDAPDDVQYLSNDAILRFAVGPFEGKYNVCFVGFGSGEGIDSAWSDLNTDNVNGYPTAHEIRSV